MEYEALNMNNNMYNRYNNSNTVNNSQNLQPQGQAVRQMLQNGGISQQQFQQYAAQTDHERQVIDKWIAKMRSDNT